MKGMNTQGRFGVDLSRFSRLASQKRGQNMTLGTVILIVLGIAVLVLLIFGFSTGWGNLWDRVINIQGKSNIDTIRTSCEIACESSKTNAYCTEQRELKYGSKVTAWSDGALKDNVKMSVGSCNDFATDQTKFKAVMEGEGEDAKATGKYVKCTPEDLKANPQICKFTKFPDVSIPKCSKVDC